MGFSTYLATWRETGNKFQAPFVCYNNFLKKSLASETKMTWDFWGISIIFFQSILFTKEFLKCNGYNLGYLSKLNRVLGLVSGALVGQEIHGFKRGYKVVL